MQPWKVSVGLTAAAAGICAILLGGWFGYLKPFWSVILEDYRVPITWHLGLALLAFAAVVYSLARATGLADLGKKVDLVERSIRRGEGDQELAEALQRDRESIPGVWK